MARSSMKCEKLDYYS